MTCLLHLEHLYLVRPRLSPYPPNALVVDDLAKDYQRLVLTQAGGFARRLTIQESTGKIDARIAVPFGAPALLHVEGDAGGINVLEPEEPTLSGAEADDDLGHA